jgi:uncharacterized protein (TIGR02466 family)
MPLAQLFATPVAMYDIPGMDAVNREVTERLVAESETVPGIARSNVGSWHSPADIQKRTEPCFRNLVDTMVAHIRQTTETIAQQMGRRLPDMPVKTHAWSMVMRNGDYTIPHDHSDVHWASVYYTDEGDADEKAYPESGVITFVDPRHGGRPIPGIELVGTNFVAKPKTGRMFVFPGWLLHYVHSYRGHRPRVCVALNLNFDVAGSIK